MPRPMPRLPPVTSATRPCSDMNSPRSGAHHTIRVMSTLAATLPRSRRTATLPLAGLATAGALAAVAVGFALGATREEQWLLATRYTARFAFPVFLIAFTASSWARLFRSEPTRELVRMRRGIGLGLASAHTVHLAALTT